MGRFRPENVSKHSSEVFHELPHGDRSIEELCAAVKILMHNGKKPLDKAGLDFGRHYDIEGKIILDAGCGSGVKAIPMAYKGAKHVIGLDASLEAVTRATAVAKKLKVENVTFVNGFIEDLDSILKGAGFGKVDVIVNWQNLHHTEDWQNNLKVFNLCLKRRGILICNVADPTAGRGNFMIKNKLSYYLGNNTEARIKIGQFLFGWLDKKKNIEKIGWEAFYADLYAAFYYWIPPRKMLSALKNANFELVDSFPHITLGHWFKGGPKSRKVNLVKKWLEKAAFLRPIFYCLMRLRQWAWGGDNRSYYARKK
jgi:2-polyprenyl-3-methyl-5-hydroxy-6-metoxy-1,4-benzoquinol methylase